ncbi:MULTISPECIES: iron-containing alcohol dehydrogenase [Desulfosediminicola]|uniref:iron-containing alcohol dehydrogenase n=1 Tax=Desulfosediminicola TaxID=2886823 RepID=UPI0010AD3286|nr:iron-containing alcohol dehydrogenase [Desulfosediminicola ganghwensis]
MVNQNFELYFPTKMMFGAGKSKAAGEIIHSLRGRNVLVVTDPGVAGANLLDGILSSLKKQGLSYNVFSDVGHEATLNKVQEGLDVVKAKGSDILLSVGGGSVMDTAKGIGCLANNPGNLADYEGPEKFKNPPLPTVAVPTTAGSGSELSFGAVISDTERKYKFSFRSSMQIPKVAILDPELLRTTPPKLAAASGMDALSHALEAYVSKWSNFMTDAYCRQNFQLVGKYLRRFVADPSDIEAASGMLLASSMGSMAFNVARLGLVHGIGHPVGANFHLPHGVACALLMPHVMQFNLSSCPDKFADIAAGLEGAVSDSTPEQMAQSAVDAVLRLTDDLGIKADFSSYDITEELLSRLADETLSSGMQLTNPRDPDKNDILDILRKFFETN